MFCGRCGSKLNAEARFCSACGAPALAGQLSPAYAGGSRLERPRTGRAIAGVCAGMARHYGWDLTWVRVIAVLLAVFSSGAGVVAYIVFWIIMPEQLWQLPATVTPPSSPSF